ncbi:YsnF/AvaK domain-containing protein [Clostridium sporogenes]|uniref:YsnF/AvaK domain-containing protein n=1 Tax=Clostridium sporogenes TaxID=1509 RepID=UPI0013D763C9|nr:YsnF/AvaK domain-containing protein [Clostridium sporogenes]NFG95277.1 YsnF/AvaK domain-containing protein [Clostridium sporogenes]NFH32960.1 YsnF/AvaK domain-containing protein [Clostridium sporogenes]NFL19682.1 YsnF/AvaK domain-containing protein [Clostridium sporogenes]NFL77485.1 YsnF/AvaK domain-containing protein [Clostridium sporogenes]NFN72893.1 YsnF/AvaK domain-containing protein [Clostridium sporogenes]
MLNKDVPNTESNQYLIAATIGGIIGFIIAILYKFSILTIPGFVTIFTIISIDPIITGTILGIVVGVIIGMVMTQSKTYEDNIETNSKKIPYNSDRDMKMQLREEQMKISNSKIQTGEVSIHKEVLTEEKNITVPVKREELVIEKTVCDPQFHDKSESHTETIRIPIKEERIDIHKQPVDLEDVSVSKDQYEEVKHITETLKKEVPHISINGDAKIVDKEIDKKYPS